MALVSYKQVSKRFGSKLAVDTVSLDFEKGNVVGLLGPNGSGKTTLIKMACGLLTPSQGSVEICGYTAGCAEAKAACAYLSDQDILPDKMRISHIVGLYSTFFQDFDAAKATQMIQDLKLDLNSSPKQLSKGMREKLQLCLTMSRAASVYFLDEPIGGVDPAARDYILRTIINNYNPNASVIIATHLISEIENILDDVVFIKNGHIIEHKSAEDLRGEKNMSIDALFREEFAC